MNDARASLDPETLRQRIATEQVALMCRLTTAPLLGSIVIGAIVAYLAVEDAGVLVSTGWYCASLAIMFIRWRVARAFLQRPREYPEVLRWQSVMLLLIALFGAIWSIPTGFLLPTDPQKEIVMSVMFIGATATGLGSLAPVRNAYAALLVPFTLPYGIHQFLMGGERLLIGLAFLLYLPVMIVIANRQTDSVERQIRLAIENEALADALRHERDRVSATNGELQTQIRQHQLSSEQIRLLNRDLELQAAELRTANDDLEGFSYSVSHDLRAPLRAIDGFSHLIEEHRLADSSGQLGHYLGRIRENIARMSMLIDDLLAFSRCGRQPVEMNELQMNELAHAAANEARSAHATQASPQIVIEPLPRAHGDERLMLQVWINLIDNAVKYSSKVSCPKIVVSGREEANRVVYEVVDNGIGFDSRYSGTLFGVFQRLHGVREYPGTGVGLAIVQRIVTRHGGQVWATSEIDRGATFGFALPKVAVPDRQRNTVVAHS
ncbi:MAG TPA: ATP-binding protein [Steroidobacteraceae bacterium]|jgi:signal transduction histidine kinase